MHNFFASIFLGDVPRVDGQLAVARAFGDRSLKKHLSSDPDITDEIIDENVDFLILASDGLWKVAIIFPYLSIVKKFLIPVFRVSIPIIC